MYGESVYGRLLWGENALAAGGAALAASVAAALVVAQSAQTARAADVAAHTAAVGAGATQNGVVRQFAERIEAATAVAAQSGREDARKLRAETAIGQHFQSSVVGAGAFSTTTAAAAAAPSGRSTASASMEAAATATEQGDTATGPIGVVFENAAANVAQAGLVVAGASSSTAAASAAAAQAFAAAPSAVVTEAVTATVAPSAAAAARGMAIEFAFAGEVLTVLPQVSGTAEVSAAAGAGYSAESFAAAVGLAFENVRAEVIDTASGATVSASSTDAALADNPSILFHRLVPIVMVEAVIAADGSIVTVTRGPAYIVTARYTGSATLIATVR